MDTALGEDSGTNANNVSNKGTTIIKGLLYLEQEFGLLHMLDHNTLSHIYTILK